MRESQTNDHNGGTDGSAAAETGSASAVRGSIDARALLERSRWDGVLSSAEIAYCREHGIPLAYDCAQIGWIPADCRDARDDVPAGGAAGSSTATGSGPALRALCRRFEAHARSVLQEVDDAGHAPADAMDELRREAAARVETFADEHGIRPADRLHWALTSTIDRMTGKVWSAQEAEADVGDPDAFRFRPWTGDDVEIYTELLGNPRVWEYLPEPFPGPFTEETARTLIEVGAFEFHHEAVAVEFGGEPIGQCLLRFDRAAGGVRTAEVAYWLGESHWGRGHMGRILPLFTRRSFEGHDLDIIYAWIHRDHEASARVAQRAGYRRDTFPLESELAETLGRPAFVRYSVTRPEGG